MKFTGVTILVLSPFIFKNRFTDLEIDFAEFGRLRGLDGWKQIKSTAVKIEAKKSIEIETKEKKGKKHLVVKGEKNKTVCNKGSIFPILFEVFFCFMSKAC